MNIRGSLDSVSAATAEGWLFAVGRKSIQVQAWLDGQIIGEAPADRRRADLAAVGFGDGNCGFCIEFIRSIGADYQPSIVVKPIDCDLELPRTSRSDPTTLLAALRRRYPSAGQTASIFGGLWTDRTDASALLAGRVAVGITPGELAAPLGQFLQDGLMVLPADPGAAAGTNGTYATLATAVLTAPLVLAVLRQVLEDNPLVLRAEKMGKEDNLLCQPSTLADFASPAECMGVIVPLTSGVGFSILRGSHRMPEFLTGGVSRWIARPSLDALSRTLGPLTLDDYDVPQSSVGILGPGTLHRLRLEQGSQALRLLLVPRRQEAPDSMRNASRRQRVHATGLVFAA